MFSTAIIHEALVRTNATSDVALTTVTEAGKSSWGEPRTSGGRITKSRKSHNGNHYASSLFRPPVLACNRLHSWVSPYAFSFHDKVLSQISCRFHFTTSHAFLTRT